uniref:EF-hand and coiled-coil domain containing 1 n=1 Tax=Cyclopterus lumpus TaxID=8103 RepID=A0A8C3ADU6_CYCLU
MDVVDSIDPYSRPARRTQWVVSTLAYHYGLDRGVENEIIVLATGLDQYLQEIFHHMDYHGGGKIPVEDFNILCDVLGLNKDSEDTECTGVLDNLPDELTFRHFHAKLCGYFSTKAGRQYENGRLLVGKDSEHIETQIRLRSPLRRREKLLSGGASSDSCPAAAAGVGGGGRHLEDENASLRELIEDMRAALQSSDARCLALQVRDYGKAIPSINQRMKSLSNLKSLQSIIHEIELLRSSRDLQVEEAMLCNERMEQELWTSKETVATLEDCNRTLKREQVGMRRKVEEARQALLSGLGKVKELEAKANHVPTLQRHVLQLESELLYYRQSPFFYLFITSYQVSHNK